MFKLINRVIGLSSPPKNKQNKYGKIQKKTNHR